MLQKQYRLTHDKDFQRLFSKGKGVHGSVCSVKFVKTSKSYPRIGIIIGKKVSKLAVIRNRLRRQTREIVRSELELFPPGHDIAFIFRPGAEKKDFLQLKAELDTIFIKAGWKKRARSVVLGGVGSPVYPVTGSGFVGK